jgi:hypothetical protein
MHIRTIFQTNSSSSCQVWLHKDPEKTEVSPEFIKKLNSLRLHIPEIGKMRPAFVGERDKYTGLYDDEDMDEDLRWGLAEEDILVIKALSRLGFTIDFHFEPLGYHRGRDGSITFNYGTTEGTFITQGNSSC